MFRDPELDQNLITFSFDHNNQKFLQNLFKDPSEESSEKNRHTNRWIQKHNFFGSDHN